MKNSKQPDCSKTPGNDTARCTATQLQGRCRSRAAPRRFNGRLLRTLRRRAESRREKAVRHSLPLLHSAEMTNNEWLWRRTRGTDPQRVSNSPKAPQQRPDDGAAVRFAFSQFFGRKHAGIADQRDVGERGSYVDLDDLGRDGQQRHPQPIHKIHTNSTAQKKFPSTTG